MRPHENLSRLYTKDDLSLIALEVIRREIISALEYQKHYKTGINEFDIENRVKDNYFAHFFERDINLNYEIFLYQHFGIDQAIQLAKDDRFPMENINCKSMAYLVLEHFTKTLLYDIFGEFSRKVVDYDYFLEKVRNLPLR